jgi:hypothetical protein
MSVEALTIVIPGKLDHTLSPNARPYWRTLAEAKQTAKNLAAFHAIQAKQGADLTGIDRATYSIELGIMKRGRALDEDNLVASCKAHLDGIAKALGVDDRGWTLGTVTQVRDPEGIGYLAIRLEWEAA